MNASNIVKIPNYKDITHYPKFLAGAEMASNKTISTAENENLNPRLKALTERMKAENKSRFTQSYFDYFGAYPYIFEAIAYLITQMDMNERKHCIIPTEGGLFFQIKVLWETFKDAALDGIHGQTADLVRSLRELAKYPKGKTIPISETQTVTTTPIRITLINKDGTELTEEELDFIERVGENINNEYTPIKGMYITCFTPFFSDILTDLMGKNWLPLPKAFYAKMIETQRRHKNDSEIKNINVTGYASTYRKMILWQYMQDNKGGGQLNFDVIDCWLHVSPSEVQTYKTKDGTIKQALRRGKKARLFIAKTNRLLNLMAKDGYLTGVTYAPQGVWWDETANRYTVYLKRTPDALTEKERKNIEGQKEGKNILIQNYTQIGDFTSNITDSPVNVDF